MQKTGKEKNQLFNISKLLEVLVNMVTLSAIRGGNPPPGKQLLCKRYFACCQQQKNWILI